MTTASPEILVHATADEVVAALTARLLARLAEIQRDFRVPQVGLTGGRTRPSSDSPSSAEQSPSRPPSAADSRGDGVNGCDRSPLGPNLLYRW